MTGKITVYSKGYCPHCEATRALLTATRRAGCEPRPEREPSRRAEMVARAMGHTTVPQIFVGDFHVGGNSDLMALEASGQLDALLSIKQVA